MGYRKLDDRTRLLLGARVLNGVQMAVHSCDEQIMQDMVRQGLFTYSNTMFNKGYSWTPDGKRAAEAAWRRVPVKRFKTRYRRHSRVKIGLNGQKEEVCEVMRPKRRSPGLRVEESLFSNGEWLIDHPDGTKRMTFKSADEAIKWGLEQLYGSDK